MVEQILKQCTVKGNTVYLPAGQLDRKVYQDVAKALNLIGGTWKGGKVQGFEFKEDPTELLAQIASGEKRNLKKEFQFFGTPDALADRLVALANPTDDDDILEPSAGQGAIVKAIMRYCNPVGVECFELMPVNQAILCKIPAARFIGEDFLKVDEKNFFRYDKIIANPPFSKNQDVDHIYKMYSLLHVGGRLVSMCSPHYQFAPEKKAKDFKQWLQDVNAQVYDVPAGEFKESGTNIATVIIVIDKQN